MEKLDQPQLKGILSTLTEIFIIDEVFLWTFYWENESRHMLQILIRKGSGQTFTDAHIYMRTVIKREHKLDYVVCYPHEMQKKVKQGLGRAVLVCQPDNLIYQHPKAKEKVKVPILDVNKIANKTENYLQKEIRKVEAFLDGYRFYLDKNDFSHAAFMLHQVIELSCRTAEHLLVGDERRTHCLKTHQNYLGAYAPDLDDLFRRNEREIIVDKLDEAYSSIRYDQDYEIEKEQLHEAAKLADDISKWLARYGLFLLQEIQEKLGPKYKIVINPLNPTTMNTPINTNHRDLILNALELYCVPANVRCFAYRYTSSSVVNLLDETRLHQEKHHYYLMLVVSEAKISIQHLQSAIKNTLPDFVDITLLPFEQDYFQKRCEKQDGFYLALMQQSEVWYENKEKLIKTVKDETEPEITLVDQKVQWLKGQQRAEHLYDVHTDNMYLGSEEVVCHGLALSLEQSCLGLLRVFWQFQPQSTGLNHLMQLCELICPEATSVFLLDSPIESPIFKLLVEAQHQFRHNVNYRTEGQHLQTLSDRVGAFNAVIKKHVDVYFEKEGDRPADATSKNGSEEVLEEVEK
ncbi:HEPN domain-containing protein [Sphingobacterium arenae]|uniref:HEPN domain-containing protein n=1 Tax=Sphingobacterium arenae TaxID=1280598 RepID=A0ABR7Y7Y8_9SPHI|nr:HEPN domain-containing protein [Sphingobacterium arenae]MBD1427427.1 HEPN domain-containing protein [Sphingobacterium arenae]